MDIRITEIEALIDGKTRVVFDCRDDEKGSQLFHAVCVSVDPQDQGYDALALEDHRQLQIQLHDFHVEILHRVTNWHFP